MICALLGGLFVVALFGSFFFGLDAAMLRSEGLPAVHPYVRCLVGVVCLALALAGSYLLGCS